jgi:hypothetical protein
MVDLPYSLMAHRIPKAASTENFHLEIFGWSSDFAFSSIGSFFRRHG